MATRVLAAIKDINNKLIGFKVVVNTKDKKGVFAITLEQALEYGKNVEKLSNVRYEKGRWSGTECSIDKMPVYDALMHTVSRNENIYILNRVTQEGTTVGFQVMDLDGQVAVYDVDTTIKLAEQQGLINASLVQKRENGVLVDKGYIKGILQTIPPKEVKSNKTDEKVEHKPILIPVVKVDRDYSKNGVMTNPTGGNDTKMDSKLERMKELVGKLGEAADVYYNKGSEIMSNFEYDKLYDELEVLEKETGTVLAGSVTQEVGYQLQSKLKKVTHTSKMLSLDKTKNGEDLAASLGGQEGFLSWKLDGLTVVATYENGEVVSAVTRGSGTVGEDITENYKVFSNVPLTIDYKDRLVLRGEALISYKVFDEINKKIKNEDDKYKNPRNLASGSTRQLDTKTTKERKVAFIGFTVVEGFDDLLTYTEKLDKAESLGFETVEYVKVNKDNTLKAIEMFSNKISKNPYPTDGLVISIDNIAYGEYLGSTNKFPRNAKAFKWKDEIKETELLYVEWSNSRTGAINPVAVFKPVDLEGTEVKRASVHNVSILESLELGEGDILEIFKANMIIPQVADNLTRSGTLVIPKNCPVCNADTRIQMSNTAKVLFCTNDDCPAKHIGGLVHFATRDAMNIDGFSESAIETFVNEGFIKEFSDIYKLEQYKDKIVRLDGFGKRSYDKAIKAIEVSRDVELHAFLYALGVEQLGRTTSKLICKAFDYDLERIITATEKDLEDIDGVGPKTIEEIVNYFSNPNNAREVREVAKELRIKQPPKVDMSSSISGKVFVITGEVTHYKNRKELQTELESLGAKAASSVSVKTDYLINNDATSGSSKNVKAKQLGIPIISEVDYMKLIGK